MRNNRLLALFLGVFLLIASLGCSLVSTTTATTTLPSSATTTTTTTTTATSATTASTTTTAPRNVRIELLATPTKLVYEFGEPFDPSGIQVAVVLSDGTSIPLSSDVL